MSKGLIGGLAWGTLIGGGLLIAVSLLSPVKESTAKNDGNSSVVSEDDTSPSTSETEQVSNDTSDVQAASSDVAQSGVVEEQPSETEESASIAEPEVSEPEPEISAEAPEAVAEVAEPEVLEAPEDIAETPLAPEPEADADAVTTALPELPAEPETPPPAETATIDAEVTTPAPAEENNVTAEAEAPSENIPEPSQVPPPAETAETPEAMPSEQQLAEPEDVTVAEMPPSEEVSPPIVPAEEATPEPSSPEPVVETAPEVPETVVEADVETPEVITPEVPVEAEQEDPAPIQLAEAPQAETTAPTGIGQPVRRLGQPVTGFGNRNSNVRINRLPSVDTATQEAQEEDPETAETPQEAVETTSNSALQKFAASFQNDAGKPVYSVVLIDIGSEQNGLETNALISFPFPVTFAIPAVLPDASDRAKVYRDAGFEVIMLASGIPLSATPSDVETTFGVYQSTLPESVAIMDEPEGGFQNNRRQAAQVVAILNDTGQGLVTFERGLNAARQLAESSGVPIATIFRQLDAENEDAEGVRRTLDRAAFKASQDGNVVVIGRTRQETVSTLFSWALEGRAEEVALAPISAAFQAQK